MSTNQYQFEMADPSKMDELTDKVDAVDGAAVEIAHVHGWMVVETETEQAADEVGRLVKSYT